MPSGTGFSRSPWARRHRSPGLTIEDEDEDAPFTTSRPTEIVFAFYRDQIDRANAVLASTPLSARPIGRHNREGADEVTDLRFIVLHMIEETARHAGHLDIARELIDGQTGLGPR